MFYKNTFFAYRVLGSYLGLLLRKRHQKALLSYKIIQFLGLIFFNFTVFLLVP